MTTISHNLHHEVTGYRRHDLVSPYGALRFDFTEACVGFTQARRQQQAKDTPAHRTAVFKGRVRIDAILDIHLDMHAEFPGADPAADHPHSDNQRLCIKRIHRSLR
jgi:hypothetical protein